jgi:tRNA dimethylallyltransferase
MPKVNNKIIIICGATASGKTGWGVRIAKKFNGEIISADSRQVFRGLDLGTGKEGGKSAKSKVKSQKSKLQVINQKLEKHFINIRWIDGVPQWMIDARDPKEKFTLFNWLEETREIIEDILSRGKTPIVVGGTGLYIQALTEGFTLQQGTITKKQDTNKSQISKIKYQKHRLKTNKYLREELDAMTLIELQNVAKKLATSNCQLETIDINNPRRLIRFIEKAQSGEISTKKKPLFQFLQIAPKLPREKLYKRIDKRVEERFEEGMLEEVEGLIDSGVSTDWLIGLGLEYRTITQYILASRASKASEADRASEAFLKMKQELKYKIHQFARRQLTWFRRFPDIRWVKSYGEAEGLVGKYIEGNTHRKFSPKRHR